MDKWKIGRGGKKNPVVCICVLLCDEKKWGVVLKSGAARVPIFKRFTHFSSNSLDQNSKNVFGLLTKMLLK